MEIGPCVMPATYAINMHHFWKLMLFMFLLTAPPTATSVQTASAFTPTSNNAEMDLLGSLSDVFTPNPLAIMPVTSATTTSEADSQTNFSGSMFAATQSPSNVMNQVSIIY
jgi:epsin